MTRDSNGHIFLDYDDELITIIVNFLRMKTVEGPSDPILYPYVNPHKKEEFRRLLRYFGLLEFFDSIRYWIFRTTTSSSVMMWSVLQLL